MTCKDCIHERVCLALIKEGLPYADGEYPAEAFCMAFRNKADFVEVVRCKDCKHSREQDRVFGITDYKCSKHNISCLSPYDFCSYGRRK